MCGFVCVWVGVRARTHAVSQSAPPEKLGLLGAVHGRSVSSYQSSVRI